MIALTETHFDFFREELFREVFAPFYYVFTNNRRGRKKGDKGSGGLAVLISKNGENSTCMSLPVDHTGNDSLGVQWVEGRWGEKSIFFMNTYIVPVSSDWAPKNRGIRERIVERTPYFQNPEKK